VRQAKAKGRLSDPRDKCLGAKFAVPRLHFLFLAVLPVHKVFCPVLRHSGRRGVQERTAARHGDIGKPRRLDLLLSVLRVGCNPHSKSARDLMLSTNPCKVFGKEGRST